MTQIKIVRMTKADKGSLRAFFTASIGDFEVEGLKLIDGKNGLFVGMPSRSYTDKDRQTKYIDIVRITSKSLLNELSDAAQEEYGRRYEGKDLTKTPANLSLDDEEGDDLPF